MRIFSGGRDGVAVDQHRLPLLQELRAVFALAVGGERDGNAQLHLLLMDDGAHRQAYSE